MKLRAESLLLFTLTLISLLTPACSALSQACDDGKANLERDLPPSDELLCPEPRPHSSLKLLSVSTIYPIQPAQEACMDVPITYNHSIPNSGAHRPVGAQSGEYLYCPPQRWINNLKHGAIVLLFHPCSPKDTRSSLTMMARSCLSHFILSAHPQLTQRRPFALVSWGRTLEMSYITKAGVCAWLSSVSLNQATESQHQTYNMYLTHAAPTNRILHIKSVRACCLKALSATSGRARKTRAALSRETSAHNKMLNSTHTQSLNMNEDKDLPAAGLHDHTDSKERGGGGVETRNSTADAERNQLKAQSSSRGEKELEKVDRIPESQADVKSHIQGVGRHRVKTDAEEQSNGHGRPDVVTPAIGGPLRGRVIPLRSTDEAVWAAAALGFLFVLLALSVLHTRLYRHWRKPSTLYWYESQQDYDSVADIIRRRLKMVSRRKRRPSQSRRHECPPLLPNSSTDNDSD